MPDKLVIILFFSARFQACTFSAVLQIAKHIEIVCPVVFLPIVPLELKYLMQSYAEKIKEYNSSRAQVRSRALFITPQLLRCRFV